MPRACLDPDCKKQPSYNVEGATTGLYCNAHKKAGMVDVISKTCLDPDCKKQPIYNVEGATTGLYCKAHKKTGMVNVKSKTCHSEWCTTLVTEKYDGYCLHCYMHLFPTKPVARNYKTKEFAVVEFVKHQFVDFDWVCDRQVADGCSRRRPDLLLDLGDQVLIVEIDENQHTGYDCSCENKRLMELSRDVGHRAVVFIRFNPDAYTTTSIAVSDGTAASASVSASVSVSVSAVKDVPSCWSNNKRGVCTVKKTKTREWATRLHALAQQIEYWAHHRTDKTIEVVQLFYDE
jgi:hypothetical protein